MGSVIIGDCRMTIESSIAIQSRFSWDDRGIPAILAWAGRSLWGAAWVGWMSAATLAGAEASSDFERQLADWQARISREPTNATLVFQAGDFCFDEGARENRRAVDLAEAYFRRVLILEETNMLAKVMLGSTLTMQGRDAFWPTTKLRYVRQGIQLMDAAVAQEPQNPRVRFERAVNNFHMPGFLDRGTVVRSDLEWLWEQVQNRPAELSIGLRQNIALYYGLFLRKQRQKERAEAVWQQGIEFGPETATAGDIQKAWRGARQEDHRFPPSKR
jgi:hypothetical protein